MMLASSLRKREEDLLLSVEEYCLEDLLPNLHLRPGDEILDDAVTGQLEQMADFAEDWRKQVSPVLKSVEQYSKGLAAQVRGLQPLIQKFSESFFEAKDEMGEIKKVEKNNEKSASLKTEDLQEEGLMNNSKESNR